MKDLFVCYAGEVRSPMAVEIAKRLAGDKGIDNYEAESCSIVVLASRFVDERIFGKYDRVFVMEPPFKDTLLKRNVPEAKIIILDVVGELERSREDVRGELERKLRIHFENKAT